MDVLEVPVIRCRRSVVDQHGIAQLHGLPFHTARRRRTWAQPGHPPPVNLSPGERPRTGRPALWDHEQAAAYAQGRPIPPIPHRDHPDDLLDAWEVAAAHEVPVERLRRAVKDGRVASPDATPCGVDHWRRATAATVQLRVANPQHHVPSPAESAEVQRRLVDELRAMTEAGLPLNKSELARRARVTRATVYRFLNRQASS